MYTTLNKPAGMRFIIADTTALLHMGRRDFVLLFLLEGGFCPREILSGGDYVQGGFCPFPATPDDYCFMIYFNRLYIIYSTFFKFIYFLFVLCSVCV